MTTIIDLSIDPAYVPSWGIWESTREFLQNAMDGHDSGYPMTIEYNVETETLCISNAGVTLPRSCLLLGRSAKRDDPNMRGQFGEGFKLGLLALVRQNRKVSIETGAEVWTPLIEESAVFGAPTLKIEIDSRLPRNSVDVRIHPITSEEWDLVNSRVIRGRLGEAKTSILKDRQGQIFANGLWVETQEGMEWSYNFLALTLDRDRKMSDPGSLAINIGYALEEGLTTQGITSAEVYDLLSRDNKENENISWDWRGQTSRYKDHKHILADAVLLEFNSRFETEAENSTIIPVSTEEEVREAPMHTLFPILTSASVRYLIESKLGSYNQRRDTVDMNPSLVYKLEDLTENERYNYTKALSLLPSECFKDSEVFIVDFVNPKINGVCRYSEQLIYVSRRQLASLETVIGTLVHEVAHLDGSWDGSITHRQNMQDLFSRIVVSTSKRYDSLVAMNSLPDISDLVQDLPQEVAFEKSEDYSHTADIPF